MLGQLRRALDAPWCQCWFVGWPFKASLQTFADVRDKWDEMGQLKLGLVRQQRHNLCSSQFEGRGVARGDGPGEEVKVRKEQEEEEEEEEEEEQEEEEQEEEEGYTLSLLC